MTTTPNLDLPYIMAAQAQKHVTHNEAIRALDALVQLSVIDRDLATPPSGPADGARYIVAAGATGAWAGHAGEIAAWQDGAWMLYPAHEGWVVWVADEDKLFAFDGAGWVVAGGSGVNPAPLVGVNATADTTNRLSVASPASLLSHAGTDHRLKVNKAAAADTASLLFQTAFSGRAEMGLAADDNFRIKVSPDGSAWLDAIVVDRTTGAVSLPASSLGSVNPNLLINGDFQINQRAFAGGALAAGAYGFDRWKAAADGSSVVLSVAGYVVTLRGTLEQPIEPALWGRANFASTQMTVSVEAPSGDLTVSLGSATGTITAGSGRRSVTLTTGAGDTGNLPLRIAAGPTDKTLGRIKLEFGAAETGWQPRPRTHEEILCKRYYQRIGGILVTDITYRAYVAGGTYLQQTMVWPVEMRAAPTATIVGTWGVLNCGQPSISPATVRTARLQALATTTGDTYFYANVGTYINLTAEL